jgi:uncharacterized membrane protein HdeD (DUF308 family)
MAMGSPFNLGSPEELELGLLKKNWGLVLAIGIGMILLGIFFISATIFTTLLVMEFLGIMLLVAAGMQLANAVTSRQWRGFLLNLLAGLVQLVVGLLLLAHPAEMAVGLTLVLAAGLIIAGLFRVIIALVNDFFGRFWVLLNGFVTFVLGVLIWRSWPASGLWVIALFLGIDTILCGWTWVMFAMKLQQIPASGAQGPPQTAPPPQSIKEGHP